MSEFLFTSESVSMGHPDKVSDQISDGILDALIAVDPTSRVACETLCTTDYVQLSGEITSAGACDDDGYRTRSRASVSTPIPAKSISSCTARVLTSRWVSTPVAPGIRG